MQLALATNADLVADHDAILRHVLGLHRGSHCRRSLREGLPLLKLDLLVDVGLSWLHLIGVIEGHGRVLAVASPKLDRLDVLVHQALDSAFIVPKYWLR